MKKYIVAFSFVILGGLSLSAQPAEGNPGGAPAPIPGLVWLAAAGAAVGYKALNNQKSKEE